MNLIKRINIGISIAVMAVCAGAFLLFGWSGTGWKALAVPTDSMRPGIPRGSLVLTRRVPVTSLKVGDVITHIDASDPKITITHRIIREFKLEGKIPVFVTKGDANKLADTPVVDGDIIGKVTWHVPDVGWVLINAKNPWVTLPIIYITGLFIMIEEVVRLRDYFRFCIPYRVPGFIVKAEKSRKLSRRAAQSAALTTAFLATALSISPQALAQIKSSNSVSLTENHITAASIVCCPKEKHDIKKCHHKSNMKYETYKHCFDDDDYKKP